MQNEVGTLHLKFHKLLATYRSTPHSTTGRARASVLLRFPVRSRLHILQPSPNRKVDAALYHQRTTHDKHAKKRSFEAGDYAFVKQHVGQKKWRAGVVIGIAGPLTYDVQYGSEAFRRHIDDLLPNLTTRKTDEAAEDEERILEQRQDAALPSPPLPRTLSSAVPVSKKIPVEEASTSSLLAKQQRVTKAWLVIS